MRNQLPIERFLPTQVGELELADQRSSRLLHAAAQDLERLLALASQWQEQLVAACRHFGWLSLTARILELVVLPRRFGVDSVSSQAVLETLALAALAPSLPEDQPVRRIVPPDSAMDMHDVCGSIVKASTLIEGYAVDRNARLNATTRNPLGEIRSAQIREAIMNRGPGHFLHPDVEMLQALFDFDDEVERMWKGITGLSPRTALRLSGYLSSRAFQLVEAARDQAAEESRALAQALDRRWKRAGQGLEVPIEVTGEVVFVPARTPEPVLAQVGLAVAVASVAEAAGSIGAADLLAAEVQAGIPQDEFSMYLNLFGGDSRLQATDVVAKPLQARLALRRRPILNLQGRHSFIPLANHVAHGLRRRLDEDLMSDERTAKRYRSLRARFTEARATELMRTLTGADFVVAPAYYELEEGGRAEIDAVLGVGPYLYLVEVKGRDLRPRAQAGSANALVGDLQRIVKDASQQLHRANERIVGGAARVRDSKGRTVVLPDRPYEPHSVFSVAVTYERLVGLAPTTWRLEDEGLIPRGLDPWVVSLPELAVVAEILAAPFELPAYLGWRRAVLELRTLEVLEESDLLMAFLADEGHGLPNALARHPDEAGQLADQTQALSDYYVNRAHGRPTEVPRKVRRRAEQELMAALARCDSPAKWAVAQHLLSLGEDDRRRVARVFRRSVRPGRTRSARVSSAPARSSGDPIKVQLGWLPSGKREKEPLDSGKRHRAAFLHINEEDGSISEIRIEG